MSAAWCCLVVLLVPSVAVSQTPEEAGDPSGAVRAGGFSLHAGVTTAPHQRGKLERLCRYPSRPPIATERLALTASGWVRYALKTLYRDGDLTGDLTAS
jgi:hypothetical protein